MLEFKENKWILAELEQAKQDGIDYDLLLDAFEDWWNEEHQTYGTYCYTYVEDCSCERCVKKNKRDSQSKVRDKKVYLITFTIDPKKHPDITDQLCRDIEDYIIKQPNRTALHIKNMSYVKEMHKNGRPHWHTCVTTTRAIRSDAFRQYERVYGNVDISRNKHTNDADILAYMSKDSDPINIQ